MNESLLLILWLLPLLLVPLAIRANGSIWLVVAALPALMASLLLPTGSQVEIPWLLLGTRLGLDASAAVLLLVASLLWLAAACYVRLWLGDDAAARRFRVCFLLAMCGNFGVIAGQDLVSFYLSFSAMGLAAYGLIVHGGQPSQQRAGRVYLSMTILGEMLLFVAFMLIYQRTGNLAPDSTELIGGSTLETGLLILAFAIKAGVLGVHFWLPLAHPAAPVPASAVLSGAMIKTALIGWIRFLPLGEQALPEWGQLLVISGSLAALLTLVCGLSQRDPKVVLAYSSIGKMGLMVAILGLALLEPGLAEPLVAVIVLFAAHHGLAKGALFLGVGLVKASGWRFSWVLLLLPALVLAGAPLTSGAYAKAQLSAPLSQLGGWGEVVAWILVMTAIATPLLMARFLYLLHRIERQPVAAAAISWLPWLVLVAVLLAIPVMSDVTGIPSSPADTLTNPSGLLIALSVAGFVWWRRPDWIVRWVGTIPPGDILMLFSGRWLSVIQARCISGLSALDLVSRIKPATTRLRLTLLRQPDLWPGRRQMGFGSLWLGMTTVFLMLTFWS
ncbi:complex I subunit 5 family protein [Marinobacterium jannaschii]|uniref:complex I subunit 5 family protein n=1 Tax=Marinobacterium jannaschii TaxID=64970 RepID=UPI0006860980|nr:proton-conducting transporter membrane subunit [Marinobacterium jannaschii]